MFQFQKEILQMIGNRQPLLASAVARPRDHVDYLEDEREPSWRRKRNYVQLISRE